MADSLQGASEQLVSFGSAFAERLREEPYPLLALGVMAGYVAGGGLFSPWTRPIARAAMGALMIPGVRERLRGLAEEFRASQSTDTA